MAVTGNGYRVKELVSNSNDVGGMNECRKGEGAEDRVKAK